MSSCSAIDTCWATDTNTTSQQNTRQHAQIGRAQRSQVTVLSVAMHARHTASSGQGLLFSSGHVMTNKRPGPSCLGLRPASRTGVIAPHATWLTGPLNFSREQTGCNSG